MDTFVSQPITPVREHLAAGGSAPGEPAFPSVFRWQGTEHRVETILRKWKDTAPCRNGSREQYVNKHWFRIRTAQGLEMTVYFERRARPGSNARCRWWLYTVSEPSPHRIA